MSQGILSGEEIRFQVQKGSIDIDPWNTERLNPASYDLTLGSQIVVYADAVEGDDLRGLRPNSERKPLHAAKENPVRVFNVAPGEDIPIFPGIGYLMHTFERIHTDVFVPIIDGKSSLGRLFVKVHETAGYGDPGFDGQYTLEVTCVQPVVLRVGMRICQMRFHTIVGEVRSYKEHKSNYTGVAAQGAVPSRAWRMFEP